jgi:hypothetical protein
MCDVILVPYINKYDKIQNLVVLNTNPLIIKRGQKLVLV